MSKRNIVLLLISIFMIAGIMFNKYSDNKKIRENLHRLIPNTYTTIDSKYIVNNYNKNEVINVYGSICLSQSVMDNMKDGKIKLGSRSELIIEKLNIENYEDFLKDNEKVFLYGNITIQYKYDSHIFSNDDYYVIMKMSNAKIYLGQGTTIEDNIDELLFASEDAKEQARLEQERIEQEQKLEQEALELLNRCVKDKNGVINVSIEDIKYAYENKQYCSEVIDLLENNIICVEDTVASIDIGSKKRYDMLDTYNNILYTNTIDIKTDYFYIDISTEEIKDSDRIVHNYWIQSGLLTGYYGDVWIWDTTEYIWAKNNIESGLLCTGSKIRVYGELNYDTGWLDSKEIKNCYKIEILDEDKNVISTWTKQ